MQWRSRLAGALPAEWQPLWADHFGSVIRTLATLVSIAVIANSVSFVVRFHYPMAFWDFWNWIDDYQRFVEGHYRLIDLFNQHNEHRIFTTRLFLFADALFGHMNGWIPLVANFGLLGTLGLILYRLASSRAPGGAGLPCLFYIAAALSTCQVDNLIAPFQIQFALLVVCVAAAAACLAAATEADCVSRVATRWLAAGILFMFLAAFSMANGILAAPPLILLLLLRRASGRQVALAAAGAVIAGFLYLHNFVRHPLPNTLLPGEDGILFRLTFALRFAGGALGAYGAWPAWLGSVLGALAAMAAARAAWRRWIGHRSVSGGDAALIAIAGFGVASAAAAAAARGAQGMPGATFARYAILSLMLSLSAGALAYGELGFRPSPGHVRSRAGHLVGGLCGALAIALLILVNTAADYNFDAKSTSSTLAAVGAALRANVIEGPDFSFANFRPLAQVRPTLLFLRAHQLNMFAPNYSPPDQLLARLAVLDPARLPRCVGDIEVAAAMDPARVTLTGWLADAAHTHTADWITVAGAAGAARPVAADIRRKTVGKMLHMQQMAYGYHGNFALPAPFGDTKLWVVGLFDRDGSEDCALPAPPSLQVAIIQKLLPKANMEPAPLAGQPALSASFAQGAAPDSGLSAPWPFAWFYSSSAASDATTRRAELALNWAGTAAQSLVIPFATGPDAHRQSLEIAFADGARFAVQIPYPAPWPAEWFVLRVPGSVIVAHGGGIVHVAATDAGTGWGQWVAVAQPMITDAPPRSAALY